MPAPKPEKTDEDATRVSVSSEGFRTESPAVTEQLHVQSLPASAPFLASVPVQQVHVPGPVSSQQLIDHKRSRMSEQSRVRGDQPESSVTPT
eukprot:5918888-Amphidinium_carterae.1